MEKRYRGREKKSGNFFIIASNLSFKRLVVVNIKRVACFCSLFNGTYCSFSLKSFSKKVYAENANMKNPVLQQQQYVCYNEYIFLLPFSNRSTVIIKILVQECGFLKICYFYVESISDRWIEERALIKVNNCCNTNIFFYLETSCGQSSNPYLNVVHLFDTSVN